MRNMRTFDELQPGDILLAYFGDYTRVELFRTTRTFNDWVSVQSLSNPSEKVDIYISSCRDWTVVDNLGFWSDPKVGFYFLWEGIKEKMERNKNIDKLLVWTHNLRKTEEQYENIRESEGIR